METAILQIIAMKTISIDNDHRRETSKSSGHYRSSNGALFSAPVTFSVSMSSSSIMQRTGSRSGSRTDDLMRSLNKRQYK